MMDDLISREKALYCFNDYYTDERGEVRLASETQEYKAIENLPSENAIPISWINEKLELLHDSNDYFVEFITKVIKDVVHLWEEEKEEKNE